MAVALQRDKVRAQRTRLAWAGGASLLVHGGLAFWLALEATLPMPSPPKPTVRYRVEWRGEVPALLSPWPIVPVSPPRRTVPPAPSRPSVAVKPPSLPHPAPSMPEPVTPAPSVELPEIAVPEAPPATPSQEGNIVARYVEGTVTLEEFLAYLRDAYGTDPSLWPGEEATKRELLLRLLVQMILYRMAAREAERQGLADPSTVEEMVQALLESRRLADWVERVLEREVEVSEAELLQHYLQHREEWGDWSFSTLRPLLEERVREEKAARLLQERLEQLRAQAQVETHFEVLRDPSAPDSAPLFVVDGQAFTLGQWRRWLRPLPPEVRAEWEKPEQAQRVLEALLYRQLVLQQVPEETSPGERRRLREQLLMGLLHQREVDSQVQVGEEDIQALYQQIGHRFLSPPEVKYTYICWRRGFSLQAEQEAMERAQALRGRILQSGDFEGAAQEEAKTSPQIRWGQVTEWTPLFSHHLLDPVQPCPLCSQLARLPVGQVSLPFWQDRDHLYLVRLDARRPGRAATLEEIRPLLEALLWESRHRSLSEQLWRRLYEEAQITLYPEALRTLLHPSTPGPSTGP